MRSDIVVNHAKAVVSLATKPTDARSDRNSVCSFSAERQSNLPGDHIHDMSLQPTRSGRSTPHEDSYVQVLRWHNPCRLPPRPMPAASARRRRRTAAGGWCGAARAHAVISAKLSQSESARPISSPAQPSSIEVSWVVPDQGLQLCGHCLDPGHRRGGASPSTGRPCRLGAARCRSGIVVEPLGDRARRGLGGHDLVQRLALDPHGR